MRWLASGLLFFVALSAQAGGESELLVRLMARFESRAVRIAVERAGISEFYLGKAASGRADWRRLAAKLGEGDLAAVGRELEPRLARIEAAAPRLGAGEYLSPTESALIDSLVEREALREFKLTYSAVRGRFLEGGSPGTAGRPGSPELPLGVEVPKVEVPVPAREARALAADLLKPLPKAELDENIRFLAKEFNTTEAEILRRMKENRAEMREIVARAGGWKPGDGSLRSSILDRMSWGFRDRKLANPDFARLMATMVSTEVVMTLISEYTARGENFWNEIDYVVADLITFTLAEIVLTWVTHGTATSRMSLRGGAPVPSTVFDSGFSAAARTRAFVNKGLLLGGAGFGLGLVGNGTVELFHAIRDGDKPGSPSAVERVEKVLWNAFLVGSFMAISSNFRYQAITKISSMLKLRFPNSPVIRGALGFPLAYGNNFVGGVTYVWYAGIATPAIAEGARRLGFEKRD